MEKTIDYEKQKRIKKQTTCKHVFLIGKSNGKFECVDCDILLNSLPKGRNMAF